MVVLLNTQIAIKIARKDNMVKNNIDDMAEQVYSRFSQVKETIQGVEAIDYFFAKEMFSALITAKKTARIPTRTVLTDSATHSLTSSPSVEIELEPDCRSNLYHLFLALSASLRAGHSCLPLTAVAEQHWGKGYASINKVDKEASQNSDSLAQELSHPGFVFAPLAQLQAMVSALNIVAADHQLLVLHHNNLYLRRYFQFESDLGQAINARLLQKCSYDNDNIEHCIDTLFPNTCPNTEISSDAESVEIDWQKVAVANAINKNFSVIAGGPGTGKTYTVTKLLAALIMLEQIALEQIALEQIALKSVTLEKTGQGLPVLNIALVAPTGKAAQRLSESIINAISGFKGVIDDKVLTEIPTQAQTLHRLLGVLPNSPNFRHNEANRLAYDIVLIDEVSMVDLPLMTRVFRALKDTAKVILLGDADQLPSVATGSVLADIAPRPHGGFSIDNEQYLTQVCQLIPEQLRDHFASNNKLISTQQQSNNNNFDYLSFLVKSRRFDGQGGIGLIANAVINGDVNSSWQLLSQTQPSQQRQSSDQNSAQQPAQLSLAQGELAHWLAPLVKQYYQPIEDCSTVSEAFALLSTFRVLCATRQGDYGVERINEVIKGYLGKNNAPFQQHQQTLYHGQPIMINENDYRLGLYNGDIGIIWRVVDNNGKTHLMACFEDTSFATKAIEGRFIETNAIEDSAALEGKKTSPQAVRHILPSRLPKFESVYAMTIHKTQGSEFSHVAMVLSQTQSEQQLNKQQDQRRGSKLLSRELLYTGITRAKKQLTIAANQSIWQQGVTAQVKRYSGLAISSAMP